MGYNIFLCAHIITYFMVNGEHNFQVELLFYLNECVIIQTSVPADVFIFNLISDINPKFM